MIVRQETGTIVGRLDRTQAAAIAVWLAFGGAVLFFGWHLEMFNRRGGPGPGFFLKGLAALLLILTLLRALTLLREAIRPAAPSSPATGQTEGSFRAAQLLRFVLFVLALTLYAYLLPSLGFLAATTALCWAALVLLGRHPLRALIEAAVGAFLVRFAFTYGLGVPLPEARIGLLSSLGL